MEINNYSNYTIYEDGRVWSKNYNGTKKGAFLKPFKLRNGYFEYQLYKDNKTKHKTIHRLIAEHYIPNPNNLPTVDHINGIKDDNRIENLRWASYSTQNLNKIGISNNSGHTYILDTKYSWVIQIGKLKYIKYYSKKKYTLEEIVFIRDMILDS